MDPASPRSLLDLCIDLLAKRIDILWTWRKRPLIGNQRRVDHWKDHKMFLNSDIADKLLERLSYEKNLDDSIFCTFTNHHVHLQNVRIAFCQNIRGSGLQVLSHHKLTSLHIVTSPKDVGTVCFILTSIGSKSYESLQHLAFWRYCKEYPDLDQNSVGIWPDDDNFLQQSIVGTFSRFNCLRSVDVRGTNLTNTNLAILGKSLPHVENLDLSWNWKITDISPLKNCQKTLKSLSLCELYDIAATTTLATLVKLSGLTFLDMSLRLKSDTGSDWGNIFTVDILLQNPDVLPNLVCLDLSCRTVNCSQHALRQFLDSHQSLQSLMLWGSNACEFKSLQDYRPRLSVGGNITLEQYTAALGHYNRRENDRPMADCENTRKTLVSMLHSDLTSKPFPPCRNDQLVQELLGSIPTRSSFVSDSFISDCAFQCVTTIALLLEKGIITHLKPDTKQYLMRFCHTAIQWCMK